MTTPTHAPSPMRPFMRPVDPDVVDTCASHGKPSIVELGSYVRAREHVRWLLGQDDDAANRFAEDVWYTISTRMCEDCLAQLLELAALPGVKCDTP